jgi:hypothetical protein
MRSAVHHIGQRDLDEDDLGAFEVQAQDPLILGTVDQRADAGAPVARLVNAVLRPVRVVEDLRQATVFQLPPERLLEGAWLGAHRRLSS